MAQMPPALRKSRQRHALGGAVPPKSLGLLAVAALLCAAAALNFGADPRQFAALDIPGIPEAAQRPTWHDERAAFAQRLVSSYGLSEADAQQFAGWILEASVRQELAPELLAGVVMTESSFRMKARSSMGAVGPAQVRADLWADFCGADLTDPEQNLYCGAQILAHYLDSCARHDALAGQADALEDCALRSYNVGYRNRNNVYFQEAGNRYLTKVDRYRAPLVEA